VVAVFGARQRGRPSKAGQTLEDRVRASFIRYVQTFFFVFVCQVTRVFGSITTALFISSVSRYTGISVAVTNNLRNGVQSTIGKKFVEAQQWAQLYDDMNAKLLTQDEFFNQPGYEQRLFFVFLSCLKNSDRIWLLLVCQHVIAFFFFSSFLFFLSSLSFVNENNVSVDLYSPYCLLSVREHTWILYSIVLVIAGSLFSVFMSTPNSPVNR
jgi:hypothetical protein